MTSVSVPTAHLGATEADLAWRRALFAALVTGSMLGLLWLAALALGPRISGLDIALIALFAVTLPWIVIGFWNAVIGLLIMRCARDPVATVFPIVGRSA